MAISVWTGFKSGIKATVAIGALAMAMGQAQAQTVPDSDNPSSTDVAAPQTTGDRTKGEASDGTDTAGDIVVTGTHIAGTATASPSLNVSAQQIKQQGFQDLGEVVRSLPFNFSGGQNPGVSGAGGLANQNINAGSQANLRGLGPDATLTLLNGHRLSYGSFTQGVDISTIPVAAISSVQIVPDGASAIYGSDAVGGVVNILLKPDYRGLETSARVGIPTDGGGFQQQYAATGGSAWRTGGIIVSGQFSRQAPIMGSDRSYTQNMLSPGDMTAAFRQWSGVVSAHQSIGDAVTLNIDGLYSNRLSLQRYFPPSATRRNDNQARDKSFAIAPSVTIKLPYQWDATISGTYSEDNTELRQRTFATPSQVQTAISRACYCNSSGGAELNLDGPLFNIGGGAVRLAVGGGYRAATFNAIYPITGSTQGGTAKTVFAYGEINVPLVSNLNSMPGVEKLILSAAGRFEHSNSFGGVGTPKIGLVYSPISGIAFKGTWGRSFKTPTLTQQYQGSYAYLEEPGFFGAKGYPANATVLELYGGNPNLKPERAETWSASLELEPKAVPGFHASISYFHIDYTDRVVQPLNEATALVNPIYQPFITYGPDSATLAALIAQQQYFVNDTSQEYDPANVVAIANDLYLNVAKQKIKGVDVAANYQIKFGSSDLNIYGNVSWLDSSQQITAGGPWQKLAGTVYNPPHFRARGGAVWTSTQLSGAVFVNYIGGVEDNRNPIVIDGDPMTTVDLTLSYRFQQESALFKGLEINLAVFNVANARPPYLAPASISRVPYDSTNYSSQGRVVSIGIRKKW